MTLHAAEPWVEPPLRQFIDDARVRIAVLLHPSGQVLAQSGFLKPADVMTACALAAAINASAGELGRQLDGKAFGGVHYAGREREIFLGVVPTRRGDLLLLAVFNDETSYGLVQLFFEEFRDRLAKAAPEEPEGRSALAQDFEGELNRNLAALFGRT